MKWILAVTFLMMTFISSVKAQTQQQKPTRMSCETDESSWQGELDKGTDPISVLHTLPLNVITDRQYELHECLTTVVPKPNLQAIFAAKHPPLTDKQMEEADIEYGLELETWSAFQHLLVSYSEEVASRLMLFINIHGLNGDGGLNEFDKGFVATYTAPKK